MSIRDVYLGVLDAHRARLHTVWDLRRFDVVVRVNTWAPGSVPGAPGATKTASDTPLLAGGARPKVEQLSQRDIIASGGLYQDQDLRIGPLTPRSSAYTAGVDPATFDPPATGAGVEVLFKISGPGLPAGGAFYKKVGQEITGNFGLFLVVRKTGQQHA